MLQSFVKFLGGDPNKKEIEKLIESVEQINVLEVDFESLSDEALRQKTDEFKERIRSAPPFLSPPFSQKTGEGQRGDEGERFKAEQEALQEILPEAFAVVREVSKRTLGLRPYDVQLVGGMVLHRGQIAEMRTGEGKTLVATLPLYLNALTGRGVHLVTVNDYLARRDARWMGRIYHALGLSVGILQMAAVTENGKKAFLYDPERQSPHEDQHNLRMVPRREAYAADITYGTNSEFGFDYLRDNMTMRLEDRVQRGHHYVIVDEVDNVLIDEARTPLIISGPASGDLEWYGRMAQVVKQVRPEDVEVSEKDRSVTLTDIGEAHIEQILGQPLRDPDRPEDLNPEQARLYGYLEQALRAQFLFKRNKDYLVQAGKVIIIDEFTGRLMPGRRWSDGLHQAVEAKEGARVEPENVTYATITLQNYFRMYKKLAGMTGTALTEAEEFNKIYNLEVLPIPTNLEYNASRSDSPLVEVKAKDEDGYEYAYFARRSVPPPSSGKMGAAEGGGLYYRRKDYPDTIFRTAEAKLRATVHEIVRYHVLGRPMLVGTTSVESSEHLSNRLRAESVRRLLQTLLLRRTWMEQNNREEDGRLIPELQPLGVPLEELEPAALRQFAKPLGLTSINPEDPENMPRILEILRLDESDIPRLKGVLQGGVPHQVLNARKHTEESQIIAGAGAFGAVTIATNMAGRGVDIKLGGDLAEEIVAAVHRVLRRAGYADPYDMSLEERRQAIQKMDPALYGIYDGEVKYFLQYFEDMERVKSLGGLHVIGSERHESRRIDNQLRGRAARQGDPGSSRFYLSLEDDLMRIFGGEQVGNIMQRLQVDDSLPLENRMVANLIEQSQHRVEGANFDVRKHLLEYDDVLNKQRAQIYSQRDRVFVKDDLSEDLAGMVRAEVERRVPEALADEEGPWKLLAWLDGVQPTLAVGEQLFPSYTQRLLLDELAESKTDFRQAMLDLLRRAVESEQEHLHNALLATIDRAGEALETQVEERLDALDTFLEAQRDNEEQRRPQELLEELNSLIRIQVRMNNEQMRLLVNDPMSLQKDLRALVRNQLAQISAARLVGAVEHRLGESLNLDKNEFAKLGWDGLIGYVLDAVQALMDRQRARLTGEDGQIARDLDLLLQREPAAAEAEPGRVRLLMSLSQGIRTAFDAKTHRQVRQAFTRLQPIFLAARRLENMDANELVTDVLEHLEAARQALQLAWGESEFSRLGQNAARIADFGPAAAILGSDRAEAAPASLSEPERQALTDELGRRALNDRHRGLLLNAISELWVDYLTRVEALRVSIGLEAYAQRDPLVQYKSKASEMFQSLLGEIRALVTSRAFAYQPRAYSITVVDAPESAPESAPAKSGAQPVKPTGGKKKRKRH
jgi:preprotein translocase subunit SecA